MIYEFFNDKTTGPLVNYFCKFMPEEIDKVKIIDYQILEYHTLDKKEVDVKSFQFGFAGNTFKLYISKSDTLAISSNDDIPYTGQFHVFRIKTMGGTSTNNKYTNEIKSYLIQFIRDYKLNQIL